VQWWQQYWQQLVPYSKVNCQGLHKEITIVCKGQQSATGNSNFACTAMQSQQQWRAAILATAITVQ